MNGADDGDLARLFRSALGGDEKAYGDFLNDAAALVRVWARRRAYPDLDPEDIVQETLLAVHLKRHTWRNDGPVKPWLYAIARHKLVDALRRHGRHTRVELGEVEEELASAEAETARDWEIGRALEVLTPGQRSVVRAISVEGRTIAEAARSLGMNETAVRVALHRGLAAIAKRFGQNDMETHELIKALAADTKRSGMPMAFAWSGAAILAVAVAAGVFLALLGPRSDVANAMQTLRFLYKFLVTIALALSAVGVLRVLSRPEAEPRTFLPILPSHRRYCSRVSSRSLSLCPPAHGLRASSEAMAWYA